MINLTDCRLYSAIRSTAWQLTIQSV